MAGQLVLLGPRPIQKRFQVIGQHPVQQLLLGNPAFV
jgi:hypothetical protein